MYKSKRSQATDIPKSVKDTVWERDGRMCIFCGSPFAFPEAHICSRAQGGLGVEKNIITVCRRCHNLLDQSPEREKMLGIAKRYLERIYGNIDESEVKYNAKSK